MGSVNVNFQSSHRSLAAERLAPSTFQRNLQGGILVRSWVLQASQGAILFFCIDLVLDLVIALVL